MNLGTKVLVPLERTWIFVRFLLKEKQKGEGQRERKKERSEEKYKDENENREKEEIEEEEVARGKNQEIGLNFVFLPDYISFSSFFLSLFLPFSFLLSLSLSFCLSPFFRTRKFCSTTLLTLFVRGNINPSLLSFFLFPFSPSFFFL